MWAVLDGSGSVTVSGSGDLPARELTISHPGAYALLEHERHTKACSRSELGSGVSCLATCFTPGIA